MRWSITCVCLAALVGCGAKYKPGKPVISGVDRAMDLAARPSGADYAANPRISAPVLPVMAFGAFFDLDLVVAPKKHSVEMYEFARILTPAGPRWIGLETELETGNQLMVGQFEDFDAFMPELPLRRHSTRFQVDDKSTIDEIDFNLSYDDADGMPVEVVIQGQTPLKWEKRRNGQTFNHSENYLLAALDLPHSESLFKAAIKVDGDMLRQQKIGGIVPFQFALQQIQGGMAVSRFTVIQGEKIPWESLYGETTVAAPASVEIVEEVTPPDILMKLANAPRIGQLQECYVKALEATPDLKGAMQLDWVVANGAVTEIVPVVMMDDNIDSEEFQKCVVDVTMVWTYEETVSGSGAWMINFEKNEEGEAKITMPDPSAPWVFTDGEEEPATEEGKEAIDRDGKEEPAEEGKEKISREGDDLPDGDLPDGDDLPEEEDVDLLGDEDGLDFLDAPVVKKDNFPLADFQTIHHMQSGMDVTQQWVVEHRGSMVSVSQTSELRTLEYDYLVNGHAMELQRVSVEQYGHGVPVTNITFSPAIPDMRIPFNGRIKSKFVIDVNGQPNVMGSVEAYWSEGAAKLLVVPTSPDWTVARQLLTTVSFAKDGQAEVSIIRVSQ